MIFTDDPAADFARHDAEQEAWLAKRPVCCYCWQHIQDERLFEINGLLYHTECAQEEFEKDTEDFME